MSYSYALFFYKPPPDHGVFWWKSVLLLLLLLMLALFLVGCSPTPEMAERYLEEESAVFEETVSEKRADDPGEAAAEALWAKTMEEKLEAVIRQQVAEMSLEEKAGQVLFLALRYNHAGQPLLQLEDEDRKIMAHKPGGIILFSENIKDNQQVKNLINQFQETADIPLFMAVDQEGGRVSRLTGGAMDFPLIPSARELGRTQNLDQVLETGQLLGKALKGLGFNMNMAPVADVDSNPQNPVIGDRSFGSDPELVANMAMAMARGMALEGVIPVLKHFPGHGDTDLDSHLEAVALNHSLDRLEEVEFLPFRRGVTLNMPVIMTGHIQILALDPELPATLSSVLVTDLLRGAWGYQGVVISDALEMGAISQRWSSGEAAVKALQAGVDLLLMPKDILEAHGAIVDAVNAGSLSQEKLDAAVTRILMLKKQYGLFD